MWKTLNSFICETQHSLGIRILVKLEQFYNFLNAAGREEKFQSRRDLVKWINLMDLNLLFYFHIYDLVVGNLQNQHKNLNL